MSDRIEVTASLRIERPVAEVRAQYRDMDHHIRTNVHRSLRIQWEPAAPGERKIRTTFRILGLRQFDVAFLEDAPDGTLLIRNVEGTNAGMVVFHDFVPVGEGATDVHLRADAPATLARTLLGPLFVAGARQVLKQALGEDKRDLEAGRYKPGVAMGDVERAYAPLLTLASRDAEAKRAVLSAACLLSAADGEVDSAERDAIRRLAELLGAKEDARWIDAQLTEYSALAVTERLAAEALRVGGAAAAAAVGREAILAAAVVGLVSEGMSLGELVLLRELARAAAVAEDALGPLVNEADAALTLPLR